MGFFDFITGAGTKLPDPAAATPPAADAAADVRAKFNQARAVALAKQIASHGFSVEGLRFDVDRETVTVHGKVASQADREKIILLIGNTWGTGRVDDQMEVTAPPAPQAKFYTVQKGDSLSKIAQEQYGKASLYPKIFEANKPMLKDADHIYPGQTLRIPPL